MIPTVIEPLLIDARTASRILGLSPRTLWSLTNCGTIPCVRIGRAVRYSVDDLRRWIEAQKKGGNQA